jgi:hypothetical protein
MARAFTLLISLMFAVSIQAQDPDYLALVKTESLLQKLFSQVYSDTLSDVAPVLDSINVVMRLALSETGSMEFPWDGLKQIGMVSSGDSKVRIFTWHVMFDPNHYRYFGFMQVGLKKGKVRLYELKDNDKAQRGTMKLDQSPEEWYGKLYYQILTHRYKRKNYYTLLGMDFNDSRSTIKSVEVIMLQRSEPRFAKELFFNPFTRTITNSMLPMALSTGWSSVTVSGTTAKISMRETWTDITSVFIDWHIICHTGDRM